MQSTRPKRYHKEFQLALRQVRRTPEDDVPIQDIADRLGWSFEFAQQAAAELTEWRIIETDMSLGFLPTVVEGR